MFMNCFCCSIYNHVKTDVPERHIYLASQFDELLAVSGQTYKIRVHQSNMPRDKFADIPTLLHFLQIKFYV